MKTPILPIALLLAMSVSTTAVLAGPVTGCVLDDPIDPFSPQTCTYVEPADLGPVNVPSQAPAVEDGYIPIFDAPGIISNYLVVSSPLGVTIFTLYSNSSLPNFGIPNFNNLTRLKAYAPDLTTVLTDADLMLVQDVQDPAREFVEFYLDESLPGVDIFDLHKVYSDFEALPEPTTMALFSAGLGLVGRGFRRSRKL